MFYLNGIGPLFPLELPLSGHAVVVGCENV